MNKRMNNILNNLILQLYTEWTFSPCMKPLNKSMKKVTNRCHCHKWGEELATSVKVRRVTIKMRGDSQWGQNSEGIWVDYFLTPVRGGLVKCEVTRGCYSPVSAKMHNSAGWVASAYTNKESRYQCTSSDEHLHKWSQDPLHKRYAMSKKRETIWRDKDPIGLYISCT